MSHHHSHSPSHGDGHSPGHAHAADEKRIALAAALTGAFMVAEAAGGVLAGSLALLADAGHMLIDFAGLALGWAAFRLMRRPADDRRTYGYDRFQILVAFGNGLVLFFIAAWILWEAGQRLMHPEPVMGGLMLWVAVGGLLVNIAAFFILHGGERDNVNMRGALLHVMGDLLGSIGAIAAAIVILLTGWTPIDPILSVLVSVIILTGAWRLVRDSARILIEGAPESLDTQEIGPAIVGTVPGVREVHHVHVWSLTEKRRIATLHACLGEGVDGPATVRAVKALLKERFDLGHTTIEVEYGECSDALPCGDNHEHAHDHDHAHPHGPSHPAGARA